MKKLKAINFMIWFLGLLMLSLMLSFIIKFLIWIIPFLGIILIFMLLLYLVIRFHEINGFKSINRATKNNKRKNKNG